MVAFIAFIMKPMGDIDWIKTFPTEAQADEFGKEKTNYGELDPDDDPDHWKKYDPPVVILFEAENTDAIENGKYTRPIAIYQRGEKHVCMKQETDLSRAVPEATIQFEDSPSYQNDPSAKTCRREILACADEIIERNGRNEFTLAEVLDCMRINGTHYKESTIRTHVTSSMCANAPANHMTRYDDFERIGYGVYRLRNRSGS